MKAVVFQEPNRLEMIDTERPECTSDSLLIRVESCGVNRCDIDVYRNGAEIVRAPRVLGHEIAGTVVEVGADVHGYYDSERVVVASAVPCGTCYSCRCGWETVCDNGNVIGFTHDGGFQQYMCVPPEAVRTGCVTKIPDGVTMDEAALAEPVAFCISAQELSDMSVGRSVVVVGADAVGCMHALVARASGGTQTFLADPDGERLGLAGKICGDARLVNTSQEDLLEVVKRRTGGRGAEVVIVNSADAATVETAQRLVAKRGVINLFGGLPTRGAKLCIDGELLRQREFFIVGNHGAAPRHYVRALALMGAGNIAVRDLITHRFGLNDVDEALRTVERAEGLKVIVHP